MRKLKAKSKSAPAVASAPATVPARFPGWLIAVLLALVTIALYWPVMDCGFVNYDDPAYVTENPRVQAGLNREGMRWAFSNTEQAAYWAPLMWLSHQLACQLFGLNPWGHHLINVLLHAVNTALVFLLFQRMTGATWRSVLVASLFGLHPLRVESVAWITERKDVLSACFGLLALFFYAGYAQKRSRVEGGASKAMAPPAGHGSRSGTAGYVLALLFFTLGLLSKAILVTWPFVMLLLDYWPLRRVAGDGWRSAKNRHLVLEKLPFFALAAGASLVTFIVQRQGGAVTAIETLPLDLRIANAVISYCRYLGKLCWPVDLAVFYPYPKHWPTDLALLAGGVMVAITALCIAKRKQYPFLPVGWLWFCGTLVPVIQLVQSGEQAMADRFTYLPSLGVTVLAVWGVSELTGRWRHRLVGLSMAGGVAVILCLGLTRQQLGYWKDSETLFRHALAVTANNYLAHNNLGVALDQKGQNDEAFSQYQEALRLNPDFVEAHNNLGIALNRKGQTDEAIVHYRETLRLKPQLAKAHYNLGNALLKKGQTDEAIHHYQDAVRLNPDFAEAHDNLGNALLNNGQTDEAIRHYQDAIRLNPVFAEAHNSLGNAFLKKGQTDEAIGQYQDAVRLNPDLAEAHNNLGIALGMKGKMADAINEYRETIRLKPGATSARANLAKMIVAQGRWDEAIDQYQQILKLAPDSAHVHFELGMALQNRGRYAAASAQLQKVIELDPRHVMAHNNLAWLLATCPDDSLRDGKKAVALAQQAVQLSGGNAPEIFETLAAAYAEAGRYSEAIETAQRALELSTAQKKKSLTEIIQNRLKLYEAHVPYHEPP